MLWLALVIVSNLATALTQQSVLTCPQCRGRFAEQNVVPLEGGKVRCPLCGASIRLAGAVQSKSDDDDWLNLDEPVAPVTASVSTASVTSSGSKSPVQPDAFQNKGTATGGASSAGASSNAEDFDEFMLPDLPMNSGFGGDGGFGNGLPPDLQMPAFDAPNSGNQFPARGPSIPELSSQDLEMLRGVGIEEEEENESAPVKQVTQKPVDLTFRVKCPRCESLSYARPTQVGKQIRCGDCHSMITVPPPPKPKVKYEPNMEEAKAFAFQPTDDGDASRPADPFRKSADQYLAAAEKAIEESEPEHDWDMPPISLWLTNVLRIFRDPALIGQWIMISAMAAVPAAIAVSFQSSIAVLALFIGGFLLTAVLIADGFAILEAVANDEKEVSEWPLFELFAWLGPLFMGLAAALVAAIPLGLPMNLMAPGLLAVGATMLSVYLLFPFVLLSMLDSGSVMQPFSASVSKSVTRSGEHWMTMYTASGLLFFALFVIYVVSAAMPPVAGVVIKIFATSAAVFFYFALLGQLAFVIGHSVNAKPMRNDVKREPKIATQVKEQDGEH